MADAIISMAERLAATRIPVEEAEEFADVLERVKAMRAELDDGDNRRLKEQSVNDWLSWLENTTFQMEDLLDKWDYYTHHQMDDALPDIAGKIVELKARIDKILHKKDVYSIGIREHDSEPTRAQPTTLVDSKEVDGRDSDREVLVTKLTANNGGLQLLSIAGMPGIGKTTVAQLVYNDTRVKEFFKLRIWIHVSDHFDEAEIAKGIIEGVKKSPSNPMEMLVSNLTDFIAGKTNSNENQMEMLFSRVADSVKSKKFLLILDDVWTEEYSKWESLRKALDSGRAGSKILITTRNERVAEMMGASDDDIHRLGLLSHADTWAVMKRAALLSDAEDARYHDIGRRIVGECKGLPLAAEALGRHLHSKSGFQEWENVLVNQVWERDIFPRLISSYNELPAMLKRCFSYCAVFPKDSRIEVADVIEKWMALGYLGSEMELKGREWFDVLAKHFLLQEFKKDKLSEQITSFEMHGIVHDLARFIRKYTTEKAEETCEICHPLLVTGVREYRSILLERTSFLNLCPCLATARLLRTRYPDRVPQGIENNLIHLRWLDLSGSCLSEEEMTTICKLINLQTLLLRACGLEELPSEISSLINLRHLNLMDNDFKELSESICSLIQLQILNVSYCSYLCSLPQGIHRLKNLKHFYFENTKLQLFPQEFSQLICLNTLTEVRVGGDWNKWEMLKNLDQLSGSLKLRIKVGDDSGDDVEEIREAEMKKKVHVQEQLIIFEDGMDVEEASMAKRSNVMEALELPPNLQSLKMWNYKGSELPKLAAKLHQLKHLHLYGFINLQVLPPLGLLPNLEECELFDMKGLQIVGGEFLGIAADSSSAVVSFPKLKELMFYDCGGWREWEDITAEEEESADVTIFPCLKTLRIMKCSALQKLPFRLLHKAASMEEIDLYGTRISVYTVRESLSKDHGLLVKS